MIAITQVHAFFMIEKSFGMFTEVTIEICWINLFFFISKHTLFKAIGAVYKFLSLLLFAFLYLSVRKLKKNQNNNNDELNTNETKLSSSKTKK